MANFSHFKHHFSHLFSVFGQPHKYSSHGMRLSGTNSRVRPLEHIRVKRKHKVNSAVSGRPSGMWTKYHFYNQLFLLLAETHSWNPSSGWSLEDQQLLESFSIFDQRTSDSERSFSYAKDENASDGRVLCVWGQLKGFPLLPDSKTHSMSSPLLLDVTQALQQRGATDHNTNNCANRHCLCLPCAFMGGCKSMGRPEY